MEKTKESRIVTGLAIAFIVCTYLVPLQMFLNTEIKILTQIGDFLMWVPIVISIVAIFYFKRYFDKISRETLLNCTVLVKYFMIPLLIAGAVMCVCFLLLMFTPIIIMAFAAPLAIAYICVIGWVYMACSSVFSLAYIKKSHKEKIHGLLFIVPATIAQFIFAFDVIAVMVLTVKEKKHIAKTILVLLAVFMVAVIGIVRLIIMFLK